MLELLGTSFQHVGYSISITFVINASIFVDIGHFDEFIKTFIRDGFIYQFHRQP